MNRFSKITVTLLSTLAVSSVFAQCRPGSPCSYQQGGYQQDGYQYQQGNYRDRNYQHQSSSTNYYNNQSTTPQGSTQPNPDSRRVGAKFYGERPTQNADGTMTYQGYPVYMDSSSQLAAQDPNAPSVTPGQADPTTPTSNPYSTQQPSNTNAK